MKGWSKVHPCLWKHKLVHFVVTTFYDRSWWFWRPHACIFEKNIPPRKTNRDYFKRNIKLQTSYFIHRNWTFISLKYEIWSRKYEVIAEIHRYYQWSVKYEVWNVKYEVWSVNCSCRPSYKTAANSFNYLT